jgi:dipeptidyl aminopeptidase/acylaminoacyl peptidase
MRRGVARLLAASLLAALTTVAAEAHAQRPHPMRAADYLDLEQASDPQISPDGKQVVYTRGFIDKVKDEWTGALWIMNADGTKHRFLVEGSNPVWSPDGTRLAYVAMGENPKGPQLFVRWMDAEGGDEPGDARERGAGGDPLGPRREVDRLHHVRRERDAVERRAAAPAA